MSRVDNSCGAGLGWKALVRVLKSSSWVLQSCAFVVWTTSMAMMAVIPMLVSMINDSYP